MEDKHKKIIRDMYLSGASYDEIGNIINLSRSSVYRYLKLDGLIEERKLIPKFENLSGKIFGDIEVICHLKTGRYQKGGIFQVWKCKCLRCGHINNIRAGNLKNGQKTCKTCSSKEASDTKKECLIDYNVWYSMISRAKERDIEVTLTQQDCLDIFNAQDRKCALSGVPIYFGATRSKESTASPDRINQKLGYIKGNVRWVHKYVNIMRNSISTEEFIWWCDTIAKYNNHLLDNCFPPANVIAK